MNVPVIGAVCVSRAGHDKGRAFLIVGVYDENHVLLSDGETRKIAKPKKKKLMHVYIEAQNADKIAESIAEGKEILDADVRKALQLYGYNIDRG
jgi:large subunit ribosomal protein L14e